MRTISIALFVVVSVAVFAQNKYQPMNVKVGLWEVTSTSSTNGDLPIPADVLSKLTPEQRARMEAQMKANSGKSNTVTQKSCLTREQLEKGPTFDNNRKECSNSVLDSSSSKMDLKLSCEMEGMQANGTMQIQALSPESVKGSTHIVATGNGNTMNSDSTFTAKWIGSDCGSTR